MQDSYVSAAGYVLNNRGLRVGQLLPVCRTTGIYLDFFEGYPVSMPENSCTCLAQLSLNTSIVVC